MYCGDSSFPVRKLIPKEEINSAIFLRQNPQFDGRGIVVAVLDTGVDPAAPGLQVTSDGKPKLLDIIDTTGSGDVDTSKVVTLSETEDYLFLLSGRKIKIPPHWKSYNKIFFLGIKRAFELYPEDLVKRLKDEHQKKWDRFRYQAKAKVVGKISFCKKKQKEADNDSDQTAKTLEDYKARKIVLENYESKTYHGPVLDCIVFHDGKEWLACALLEDEDPFTAKVMADYKIRQEYSTFSNQDMLSYSFNIYNEGSRLSISVCCGSHGTHVAGILAAYHPDNSGVNGIAPGAQIVSVKIGDTRLGGMETGISVIRGLSAVLKNKCDLINMSFGEDVHMADVGLFSALANAVVRKHGVVFVSSAGNQGPALSTVSAPGGTTYSLISVGAFVSKSMMDVDHSMRECVNEGYYTWSSRGPAYNGDFGVTIGAPGCAIASVPAFTLKGKLYGTTTILRKSRLFNTYLSRGGQLMNGTSMASPNACGGIALLLSALKNNSVEYTPERIRRAVVNTAQLMSNMDAFTQGYGLLNVLGAYDHAVKYRDYRGHDVSYEIRTSCGHEARGIYIREPWQMAVEKEVTVSVRPVFPENTENIEKINYKVLFVLDCEAAWIKLPRHFALMNEERSFKVLLKASSASLPPGPHFTVIKGFDSAATEVGPLFCISVTLLVPVPLSAHRHQFEVDFYPGYISRHFYQVPDGSRWAEICLVTTIQAGGTRQFAIQVQQLEAMKGHTHSGFKTHIVASDKSPWVRVIPVLPGFTLEFCLAQYWASLGNCRVKCTVHFHGVETEGSVFKIPSDVAAFRVSYTCRLGPETIKPSGTFKAVETRMAPTSYSLSPSSHPLDALPDDRCMYALCLEYPPFSVDKKDDLTPRVTSLNGRLYDSVFGT
jgi:tripeptidyl-peptidase-2